MRVQRGTDDRAEQHHAGVVDERVQAAHLGDRPLDGVSRLAFVGHVGLDGESSASPLADGGGDLFEPILPSGGERHGRALCAQRERGRRADAAGRTGHEGYRAVEHHTVTIPMPHRTASPMVVA